jgi:hypothetical protein
MKTAKKITALVLALCTLALILASCGAKPPENEATTGTEIHSFLDKLGIGAETKKADSKTEAAEDKTDAEGKEEDKTASESASKPEGETEKNSARIADVEFVLKSYYTDGVNYGEIRNIRFDDDAFASSAYGYIDVTMTYIKSHSKNLVIYYKAYDSAGKTVRNSAVVVKTDKIHSGDTVEHLRFNVPFSTVKVEFLNADEAKK